VLNNKFSAVCLHLRKWQYGKTGVTVRDRHVVVLCVCSDGIIITRLLDSRRWSKTRSWPADINNTCNTRVIIFIFCSMLEAYIWRFDKHKVVRSLLITPLMQSSAILPSALQLGIRSTKHHRSSSTTYRPLSLLQCSYIAIHILFSHPVRLSLVAALLLRIKVIPGSTNQKECIAGWVDTISRSRCAWLLAVQMHPIFFAADLQTKRCWVRICYCCRRKIHWYHSITQLTDEVDAMFVNVPWSRQNWLSTEGESRIRPTW